MLALAKKQYPMPWVNLYRPRQNRGTILRIRKETHLKNSRKNKTNPKNRMILKNSRTDKPKTNNRKGKNPLPKLKWKPNNHLNHQTHRPTSNPQVINRNRRRKNQLIWGWVLGQQRLMGLFIIKWRFGRNYPLGNWGLVLT